MTSSVLCKRPWQLCFLFCCLCMASILQLRPFVLFYSGFWQSHLAPERPSNCVDTRPDCSNYVCNHPNTKQWMEEQCRRSCGFCGEARPDSLRFTLPTPVRISRTGSTVMKDVESCDIPCLWDVSYGEATQTDILIALDLPSWRNEIRWCKESETPYNLMHYRTDRTAAIVSYSFKADVFNPYWNWDVIKNVRAAQPVSFHSATKKMLWVAGDCTPLNERNWIIRKLEQEGLVDSAGSCQHNFDAPLDSRHSVDKESLMRNYLFYAAFENSNTVDYMTEKLVGAFLAGTIPVVFGAPNMPDLVPREWYIFANDFKTPHLLAQHLRRVMADIKLYNAYHDARMGPWPAWFVQRWNFTGSAECRLCRYIAALREPETYAFDPSTQTLIKKSTIPKTQCVHDSDCQDQLCVEGRCGCTSNRDCKQSVPECKNSLCHVPICQDSHGEPLLRACTDWVQLCQAGMLYTDRCLFFVGARFDQLDDPEWFRPSRFHAAYQVWRWASDHNDYLLVIFGFVVLAGFTVFVVVAKWKRKRTKWKCMQRVESYGSIP